MLHLIPKPLHRAAYRAAHSGRKIWWRLSKPMFHGVSVLACDKAGRVLFVQLSYGQQRWQCPGGGVKSGEDPCAAAAREFTEETGLTLEEPHLLGQQVEKLHGATNIVHVVAGCAKGDPTSDAREIVAARWFALQDLPHPISDTVARRLSLLEKR